MDRLGPARSRTRHLRGASRAGVLPAPGPPQAPRRPLDRCSTGADAACAYSRVEHLDARPCRSRRSRWLSPSGPASTCRSCLMRLGVLTSPNPRSLSSPFGTVNGPSRMTSTASPPREGAADFGRSGGKPNSTSAAFGAPHCRSSTLAGGPAHRRRVNDAIVGRHERPLTPCGQRWRSPCRCGRSGHRAPASPCGPWPRGREDATGRPTARSTVACRRQSPTGLHGRPEFDGHVDFARFTCFGAPRDRVGAVEAESGTRALVRRCMPAARDGGEVLERHAACA